MKNPFEVKTPEGISAQDVHELFVNVFTDFYQVPKIGHTFLNGSRGSGKSMMFRYMMPDCQKLSLNCSLERLDYFALYVPIKLTDINYPELEQLKTDGVTYFNEHLLTTFIAIKSFKDLLNYTEDINSKHEELILFYKDIFLWHADIAGHDISSYDTNQTNGIDCLNLIIKILDRMFLECKRYCIQKVVDPNFNDSYKKSLCSYIDFLFPILLELKKLTFFPKDKPLFILIDDAGYLNETQTKILNTWVSYRSSQEVSLKISTQLDYKTFKTITNKTIDCPHDYSQVDITTIYTNQRSSYYSRIEDIVKRRIKKYLDIDIDPKVFFPLDIRQSEGIARIAEELKLENFNPEKSYSAGDASRRYATSEYVKYLKAKKSGYNFNYAGFNYLVDISSGVVRHFLEPASIMFTEATNSGVDKLTNIPASIQNEVIKKYSENFLGDEFTKVLEEYGSKGSKEDLSKADKLYNLITGLGQLFHSVFVSEKKDRAIFSIALTDLPDEELKEILHLGIHYGYLHKSTIGNKQGTGRCQLFVLSRTLAPYFKIDPTGFKGYQFTNSQTLKKSLSNPNEFVKITMSNINVIDDNQLKIFEDE